MDAEEHANQIYSRITSFANYESMNGIEKGWFIKKISEGLEAYHQSKVDAITDEMIRKASFDTGMMTGDNDYDLGKSAGFQTAFEWLKQELKK